MSFSIESGQYENVTKRGCYDILGSVIGCDVNKMKTIIKISNMALCPNGFVPKWCCAQMALYIYAVVSSCRCVVMAFCRNSVLSDDVVSDVERR